MIFEHVLQIQ